MCVCENKNLFLYIILYIVYLHYTNLNKILYPVIDIHILLSTLTRSTHTHTHTYMYSLLYRGIFQLAESSLEAKNIERH
jgi:hypothetical protein